MKSGANYIISLSVDVNIDLVEEIIFTFVGERRLQKSYPYDISFDGSRFLFPLSQEETLTLSDNDYGNTIYVEAQIVNTDKSVLKTDIGKFFIHRTLATKIIDGNVPSKYPLSEVELKVDGNIVIAQISEAEIDQKVNEVALRIQQEVDQKYNEAFSKLNFVVEDEHLVYIL